MNFFYSQQLAPRPFGADLTNITMTTQSNQVRAAISLPNNPVREGRGYVSFAETHPSVLRGRHFDDQKHRELATELLRLRSQRLRTQNFFEASGGSGGGYGSLHALPGLHRRELAELGKLEFAGLHPQPLAAGLAEERRQSAGGPDLPGLLTGFFDLEAAQHDREVPALDPGGALVQTVPQPQPKELQEKRMPSQAAAEPLVRT